MDPTALRGGVTPASTDLDADLRRRLEKADAALVDGFHHRLTTHRGRLASAFAVPLLQVIENLERITVGNESRADAGQDCNIDRGGFLREGRCDKSQG
jgi:glucose-6-phosphate dehydrogenase assembly protein OpcA